MYRLEDSLCDFRILKKWSKDLKFKSPFVLFFSHLDFHFVSLAFRIHVVCFLQKVLEEIFVRGRKRYIIVYYFFSFRARMNTEICTRENKKVYYLFIYLFFLC
jgi:hypothetical protein